MYLRLFFFPMRKGFVNLTLEWAFPRLALDITYSLGHIEKQKGAGLGSQPLVQHGPSGPWELQHSAEATPGLIYRKPRKCDLRLY